MKAKEYRCFDVSYECREAPTSEALLATFSGWTSRRGDPLLIAEVFDFGDRYVVSAMLWTSAQTTVATAARCIPEGATIDPVFHVCFRKQLSQRLCRDKSRRVLAVRAGF